jgi:hypothetical protein
METMDSTTIMILAGSVGAAVLVALVKTIEIIANESEQN